MLTPLRKKWDQRFMALARHIAQWSQDPSTKVGAVIVDRDKRVISLGYNGLPKGVKDDKERYENREFKYPAICHAERNAILFARQDLRRCIIYSSAVPCASCAGMIIQAGILDVIAPEPPPDFAERWKKDLEITTTMFMETSITLWTLPEEP